MVGAVEGASGKQGIAASLTEGLRTLSNNGSVTFTRYLRYVLPLDGFVFWVRADLVKPSAAYPNPTSPSPTIVIQGSLHYSTVLQQNEDETAGVNTMIFSAVSPIQQFNRVAPNELWIGRYAGDVNNFDAPTTFAFSSRGRYYQAADEYHYVGTAVLPVFKPQLIDSPEQLAALGLIVSNSLPIWLSLFNYQPPYPGFSNTIPLYPSFVIPDNLAPPYAAVHIDPAKTLADQTIAALTSTTSSYQLARDSVRVTLYGVDNTAAATFKSAVEQYSYDGVYVGDVFTPTFGIMNMSIIRDDKRTQPELQVIAQKKIIDFDVSYTQQCARDIARQYIEKSIQNYEPIVPPQPPPLLRIIPQPPYPF